MMDSIRNAIERAVAENRMCVETRSDRAAAEHIVAAVQQAMQAEGMLLLGKPVTTAMLHGVIERSCQLEQSLGAVAQALNNALVRFDCAGCHGEAGQALKALVDTSRRVVQMIEQTNPN